MRFSSIHKLSTYLMCTAAVASLLLSPEVGLATAVTTLLAIGLSWFADPERFRLERYNAAWNIATVLFLFYLVTDVVRGGAVIIAGANFLLFVLCNKLFNRRTSRDYLQACVLSFLLLVVSTTLNTSLSYAIAFSAYVICATWTLILLHLRREMEENYLLKHSEGAQSEKVEVERILSSRRVVGGRFLAGTSLLSLGVIVSSLAIFVFFPRVGFGIFLGHKRAGIVLAGFQDRVELGRHGVVRDNPTVVMRVMLAARPRGALRWRGSAYDIYQGGVWSHSEELSGRTQMVTPQEGLYVLNHAPGLPAVPSTNQIRSSLLRQEIYLEPLDTAVLFAADRPVAVEARRRPPGTRAGQLVPRRGPFGEIRTSAARTFGLQYVAYSMIDPPPARLLGEATRLDDPRLRAFLQLPRELPPRIGELARRITGGHRSLHARVLAVQQHLRTHYAYTLKLEHTPGLEPIDEFLFVTRRGHCEYFASAMTVLLRSIGIHARNANGFAGGVWNEYGKYLVVRQGDAHSWVEVLFPNLGWVTFDPTPGASLAAVSPAGILARVGDLADALRMRWYRHVIEYDLRQQVSMLRRTQRWLSAARTGRRGAGSSWYLLLAAAAVAAIAALLWRRRRRAGQRPPSLKRANAPVAPATQLYARLLRLLARAGHAKRPGITPGEFVDELRGSGFAPVRLVERLTGWYYDVRFGGRPMAPEAVREMTSLLKELHDSLQAR